MNAYTIARLKIDVAEKNQMGFILITESLESPEPEHVDYVIESPRATIWNVLTRFLELRDRLRVTKGMRV
jgi:hypothetical protein